MDPWGTRGNSLVSDSRIYVEGGGNTNELRTRCREAITKLLTNTGFAGRLPRIVACGSRNEAYADFAVAVSKGTTGFVALLIDSEDPISDVEETWQHLKLRDGWDQPEHTSDEQVFFMTTCMETWLVVDRNALRDYYPGCLQETLLLSNVNLEGRDRHAVQLSLENATRQCVVPYLKNKHSFALLGRLGPDSLQSLPSFARMRNILNSKL